VAADHAPAVGEAPRVEREQRASSVVDTRVLRTEGQRIGCEPAFERGLEHGRHPTRLHVRSPLGHHLRVGRCARAGDQERSHPIRVADGQMLTDHSSQRHADDVEVPRIRLRHLVGQQGDFGRLGSARAAAKTGELVLDRAGRREIGPVPGPGVQADGREEDEAHTA